MLQIKPSFVIYLLLLSYLNPLEIFYPFLCAAIVHECAHIAALIILGKKVQKISLSFAEAALTCEPLSASEELWIAAAGPAVNFLCAALFQKAFSSFAAVSFLLGLVNMLPVFPLDGGRILNSVLYMILPDYLAGRFTFIISGFFQLAAFVLTVYFCLRYHFGWMPVCFLLILMLKSMFAGKTSCFSGLSALK